jgi:hypothetical protein
MAAILRITDGTTIINLLSKTEPGYHLQTWRPNIPFYKGGGTFQESSLSWGRTLVDKQFENVIDTLELKANDINQNGLIQVLQDLRRLLEKASSYWATDWQDEPVWIEAKASQETNTRYALILTARIPQDGNPYSAPFLQEDCEAVMSELSLVIEHLPWTENQPGTGTATELGQSSIYNGADFGNVNSSGVLTPTTAEEAYRANYRNEANLTHIFIDDGGVFGGNLVGAAVPYNLLPAVPVVNDAIYFGIDTTVGDSGPFFNIIFDIGTTRSGFTGTWEYWQGAAWVGLGSGDRDNTGGFSVAGVNGLLSTAAAVFNQVAVAVNGVTAFWVRFRVTAAPGPITVPTQQNRNPYVINWPYIEVQSEDILGDISALIKTRLIERNELTSDEDSETRFLVMGSRSVSRGANFTAFINIADEQNPANITVAAAGGSAFGNTAWSPTGRELLYTSGGATAFTTRGIVTISSPLTQEYYGKYRLYVRVNGFRGAQGVTLRAVIESSSGGQSITTESQTGIPIIICRLGDSNTRGYIYAINSRQHRYNYNQFTGCNGRSKVCRLY